jgi:hypothetical protein
MEKPTNKLKKKKKLIHLSKTILALLIDWNVKAFEELLKQIVVRREVCPETNIQPPQDERVKYSTNATIDEVREIINLPTFCRITTTWYETIISICTEN